MCKLIDYGTYKYLKKKKDKEKKKRITKNKEIKIKKVNIGENDLLRKVTKAEQILKKGDNLKITIRLGGRDYYNKSKRATIIKNGFELIKIIIDKLKNYASVLKEPKKHGIFISAFITTKKIN